MTLKALRKQKGLTQEEAAELVGLSRRGYQNLEAGKYKKKGTTYDYAYSRLSSYAKRQESKRPLTRSFLQKAVKDAAEEAGVPYAYLYGDYVGTPGKMSPILLLVGGNLSDLDSLALGERISSLTGKETHILPYSKALLDPKQLEKILAEGIKIYPLP